MRGQRVVFPVFHPLQLQSVGIQKEHGIIVVVILAGRINDFRLQVVAQKGIKVVDILPAAKLKRVMMKSDIADPILTLAARCIGLADPEPRMAIGPADRIRVLASDISIPRNVNSRP